MRMEKWIFDSPDQPALAFREFIQWFFQENRLIRGELALDGRPVLLENIRCPVLNIYAGNDHLVPPSASIPLGAHIGSEDYEAAASRCRAHRHVRERQSARRPSPRQLRVG